MKLLLAIALVTISLTGCSFRNSGASAATAAEATPNANHLSEDEKHRLYSAALATSESPLDTELFTDVCRKIGIYDADGKPNDQYMTFVSQHVNWGLTSESSQFRHQINSKDKATEYIKQHLSPR